VRTTEQNEALGLYANAARGGVEDDGEGVAGGGSSNVAPESAPIDALDAAKEVEGDDSLFVGSSAQTAAPPPWQNTDGNVPGRFHKGGALIHNPTARSAATGGPVRGPDGSLTGLIFDSSSSDSIKDVMSFPADCSHCSAVGQCRMCVTDVPHFKEVILMAFTCEECGWRDVEVKGGGAVPEKGTITTLHYNPTADSAAEDMMRDVIKGDTASVEVPEIELLVEQGSLGGMYTTVEGLLTCVRSKLMESNPFMTGEATDGAAAGEGSRRTDFAAFIDKLDAVVSGRVPFTLRLRDPMANTWVHSYRSPDPDPALTHEEYVRTEEEDLMLGLLDMNTEQHGSEEAEGEERTGADKIAAGKT
jgi:ZPR1 zinc finger protein